MSFHGNLAASGDGGRPSIGVPPRRRRRALEGRELATPLAATFLGLLLVHGLGSADAAEAPTSSGAASEPETLTSHEGGGAERGAAVAALPAATVPALALGAHGSANLIDASTLTRLTGETGVGTATPQIVVASSGSAPMLPNAMPAAVPPVDLAMAQATMEFPSLPGMAGTASSDQAEDIGPIGRYVSGDGSDRTVVLTDADDIFVGGDGDEHVQGRGGDDYLDGSGGDDRLEGGAGDDTLLGGVGDDVVEGGSGDDRLDGGLDDDRLAGGQGDDHLLGGGGNDQLDGGTGTDVLEGGTGNEILVLADIRDAVTELGLGSDGGGNDTVIVAQGYGQSLAAALPYTHGEATFVLGRPDLDSFPHGFAGFRQQIDPDIENIRLEGQFDHDVVGDGRDSIIVGNAGDNQIFGGGGEDAVWGGDGDDWLDGGDGDDTLYGGGGDDTFVLGLHEGGDQVFDHEGRNTLRLDGADPGRLTAGMQGDDLVLTHADRVVATLNDYDPDNFVGIDLGHGVRAIDDFMVEPTARAMALGETGDWLADFLPAASRSAAAPLAEPWSTMAETGGADGMPEPGSETAWTGDGDGAVSAGSGQQGLLPELSFAGDPVAGGADLWLPVDPLPATGFDGPEHDTVQPRAGEEREHTT